MGYWIVIAMLVCAAIAVLAAVVAIPIDARSLPPSGLKPHGWRPLRPLTLVVLDSLTNRDPASSHWFEQAAAAIERLTINHHGGPNRTLADAERDDAPAIITTRPNMVLIWLVTNDLLAGVQLSDFRHRLERLISNLRDQRIEVVLLNLIDLADLPSLEEAGFQRPELAQLTDTWNRILARIAERQGAILCDVSTLPAMVNQPGDLLTPRGLSLDAEARQALAALVAPALERAARQARQHLPDPAPPAEPSATTRYDSPPSLS